MVLTILASWAFENARVDLLAGLQRVHDESAPIGPAVTAGMFEKSEQCIPVHFHGLVQCRIRLSRIQMGANDILENRGDFVVVVDVRRHDVAVINLTR